MDEWLQGAKGSGQQRMTANEYKVSFQCNENVRKFGSGDG